jgi:hypothetical protein
MNGGLLRIGGGSWLFGNPPQFAVSPGISNRCWLGLASVALFDAHEHETVVRRSVLLPAGGHAERELNPPKSGIRIYPHRSTVNDPRSFPFCAHNLTLHFEFHEEAVEIEARFPSGYTPAAKKRSACEIFTPALDSCILFSSTNVPRAVAGGAPSKKPVTCKGSCIGAHPKFRAEMSKSKAFEIFELSSGEIQG